MLARRQLSTIIHHLVVPFDRTTEGHLKALRAWDLRTAEAARRRAEALAAVYPGVVAFSTVSNPETDEFGEPEIIVAIGEVDLEAFSAW